MTPETPKLSDHPVVSQEHWLAARIDLLKKERELTEELDKLHAARRALPWRRVEKDYVFEGPDGPARLSDLFNGRSQLAIYHFTLAPGSDHICPGCAYLSDHVDAARQHFEQADLSFAAISRAPIAQIEAVKARMGWRFAWLSSGDSDFNYDFNVSFSPEQRANGGAPYNYGKERVEKASDMFGLSIFVQRPGNDAIYHSYSTYRRGVELLMGAANWLDLTPKGRNEDGAAHSWVRLHDTY